MDNSMYFSIAEARLQATDWRLRAGYWRTLAADYSPGHNMARSYNNAAIVCDNRALEAAQRAQQLEMQHAP